MQTTNETVAAPSSARSAGASPVTGMGPTVLLPAGATSAALAAATSIAGLVTPPAVPSAATSSSSPAPASAAGSVTPGLTIDAGSEHVQTIEVWTGSWVQARMTMAMFAHRCRKKSQGGRYNPVELKTLHRQVNALLWHLRFAAHITPDLKTSPYQIEEGLKLLGEREGFLGVIPGDIAAEARTVLADLNARNWGAEAPSDDDDGETMEDAAPPATSSTATASSSSAPTAATTAPTSSSSATTTVPGASSSGTSAARLPHPTHPIWGLNGTMHGLIMIRTGPRVSYKFDPRYLANGKRPANVFGHNGLLPGAWWPLQHVALFHGAHGHKMRGIYGTPSAGTYSIVVSGSSSSNYHDLDSDQGNTIFYSADSSHLNRNPNTVTTVSSDTRALQKSLATRQPVRVLRSAGPRRASAPSVGIRYDGLYRVVEQIEAVNANGGRYLKFRLVRLQQGQAPLNQIVGSSPTVQQKRDFERFRDGY